MACSALTRACAAFISPPFDWLSTPLDSVSFVVLVIVLDRNTSRLAGPNVVAIRAVAVVVRFIDADERPQRSLLIAHVSEMIRHGQPAQHFEDRGTLLGVS